MRQKRSKSLEEIIKACIKGDSLKQKELYELFYGRMMNICLRYSPDYATASELLNSGFLNIFNNLSRLKNIEVFEGWAKKIMVNKCLDFIKSKKIVFTSMDDIQEQDILINPGKFKHLSSEDIILMIQTLPTQTRTVFNLFSVEGYTHSEIAGKLGISVNTSAWHVNQARKILKEKISKSRNE